MRKLPHIKSEENLIKLILETIIVESDGGRVLEGPTKDFGLGQIQLATSKSLHKWLKANHKDVFEAILSLRNSKLSEKDNLKHNLPYTVAMMVTEYWRKSGQNYGGLLDSKYRRAVLWKSVYNTRLGEGTINAYLRRVRNYHITENE